jgi:glycosyltransferase involved in cell wall biosynthesis
MFALVRGLPYIFDMDSCMPDQLQNSGFLRTNWVLSLIRTLECFFIRQASAVLTVCTALSEKARQYSPETAVFQVEDFPCESSLSVNAELANKLRKEHFAEDRRVILYTGNLEPYQGIDLLLQSFALLIQAEGSSQRVLPLLVLVGGGSADSPEIRRYVALTGELGIREHVRFFGSRPAEEMGTLMALADVLVSPRSEGENTPLKIFSYMAAGKPIAATSIRSHTQVLDDESAFLARAEPEDFSKMLAAALHNEEKRSMVVSNAKQLVKTKFNRESFERRLLEMYAMVVGPGSSARGCSAAAREPKSEESRLLCLSALFFGLCFI